MKAKRNLLLGAVIGLQLILLPLSASAFYDPMPGRWVNRDPIGEAGGINL